jgi:UDPglucose--hexose-1-phosphate uridylyltransferase
LSEPEIRIDQLTGLRTLLAPGRSDRPGTPRPPKPEPPGDDGDCPFCEGSEDRTPPEVDAIRPGGGEANGPGWLARTVPNLYPVLPDPGAHEVIVHGPSHKRTLLELDDEEFAAAIEAWRARSRAHAEAKYVHLIVNEGPAAGASLDHTHAQLYALSFVPTAVARERERFAGHAHETNGGVLLEDVAADEVRQRERLVAIDDEALLVCPWASRGPFELRVIPRQVKASFGEDTTGGAMLRTALRALAARFDGCPPFNLWVRTAPYDAEFFHWHIDVLPRLTIRAGFEIGTGVEISTYAPERAAAELRECLEGAG